MIGKCEYCGTLFDREEKRCDGCGAPLPLSAWETTPRIMSWPSSSLGYWIADTCPLTTIGWKTANTTTTNNVEFIDPLNQWSSNSRTLSTFDDWRDA